MIDKLILGRYVPGDSFLHRLDPRAKLVMGLLYIGILFLVDNWITTFLIIFFTFLVVVLTQIKVNVFMKGIRPLIWLILFTVVMQLLFTGGGEVYFQWGAITISSFGIANGALVFLRFTLLIVMSTVVTLTTKPMDLADAISYLLKPFSYLRMPVQDIALMLTVSMRFIPTLMEETDKIMKAQRARGVDFGEGNIFEQMKKIVPVFIPLFVSSFNRAEDLANAMEVRGYEGDAKRTRFRLLHWHGIDAIAFLVFIAVTVFLWIL